MLSAHFLGLVALHVGFACCSPLQHPYNSSYQTAYFQDMGPNGSYIVALKISDIDGTVSNPVLTSTGGYGVAGLIAVSQDSVVVSENYLFTPNPGSDTLSVFYIDPADPEHPTLIGKPAPTLGKTPTSVAYSPKLNTACVLNAGSVAGVTCYSVDRQKGLTALGGLRLIPQTQLLDTSPSLPGPLFIAQDITFNPSSTALFISVRSNGKNPGLIYAFPVVENTNQTYPHPHRQAEKVVSTTSVLSSFPNQPIMFSLNFLDNNDHHLLVTSPHLNNPGAAFLTVSYPSLAITLAKTITIPDQAAVCWAAYAPRFDAVFIIDSGLPNITVVNPETGDVEGVVRLGPPNTNYNGTDMAGGLDSIVAGNYLYELTLSDQIDPQVDVFKIGGPGFLTLVQSFHIFEAIGRIPAWMGMAVWPAPH
ncbi:MAG: hypothetical protein Q9175_001675 [Cornicularia normoerica]